MKQKLWWDTNCDKTCFVIKHRDKLQNLKEHTLRKDINCDEIQFFFFSFFLSNGPWQVLKILFPRPIATTETTNKNITAAWFRQKSENAASGDTSRFFLNYYYVCVNSIKSLF